MTIDKPVKDERYKLHLGPTRTFIPLQSTSDLLSRDPVINSIVQAGSSGDGTEAYYEHMAGLSVLYTSLGQNDDKFPMKGQDKQRYICLRVKFEPLSKGADGNIVPDGKTLTINGKEYQGVGMITHTIEDDSITLATYSRAAATTVLGPIPQRAVQPWINLAAQNVYNGLASCIQKLFTGLQSLAQGKSVVTRGSVRYMALKAAEGAESELAESGAVEILATGAEAGAAEAGTAAAGAEGNMLIGGLSRPFFGACISLAVILFTIPLSLPKFHRVRIFNLAGHIIEWTYYLDPCDRDLSGEGNIVDAPGTDDQGSFIPAPIAAAQRGPGIPGIMGSPEVHYGDITVVSSNKYDGIGYALQLFLKDRQTKERVQTITVYYDIPFIEINSTDLTFKDVESLAEWYDNNSGEHKSKMAYAASTDGRFEVRSTYDHLSSEHRVPSQFGKSANEAYFYRSVLYVLDTELRVEDLCRPGCLEM